jgi:hypothetical protein
MRKSLWIILTVLVLAIGAPYAQADTTSTFDVSGTALNDSTGILGSCASGATCAFSGTLTIDVTNGNLTAVDITFPGLASFTSTQFAEPSGTSDWFIGVLNSSSGPPCLCDALTLFFTTTMTPGSLVDFTGGSIFGLFVLNNTTSAPEYSDLSGSITPAPAPEPSSLAHIFLGLGALLVMRKRMGHSRSSVV